jgi:peptidoglycan/xylan/chitin deacetylase (PgdA/CDA1 family)
VLAVAQPRPAAAAPDIWPQPAAGPSASGDPELVLTFDDGPHEDYTPIILDELGRRSLKATFFWVGHRVTGTRREVARRVAVARRALREGHLIGNHTIHHVKLCSTHRDRASREIDGNARIYEQLFAMPLTWFRAPYGANCRSLRALLHERGLAHLHWDMDPREWEHHDSATAAAYIIEKLRRLEGRAVLLLHDTNRVSVRVLPRVLDWIDGENQRRRAAGERPLRILSFVDLAREQLAPGVEAWLVSASVDFRSVARGARHLIPTQPAATLTRLVPR